MIQFIDIPTEQTTAATDMLLFITSIICIAIIYNIGKQKDFIKAKIWIALFGFLSLASILGAVAHGFKMSEQVNFYFWQPLYLSLGLAIAMFVVGVMYDLKRELSKTLLYIMITLGLLFYLVTIFIPGLFVVFIIFESIVMIFALIMYLYLTIKKKVFGGIYMFLGILVTIIAATIQASENVYITIIWEFDFNSIFHLLQTVGLILIVIGLNKDFIKYKIKKI